MAPPISPAADLRAALDRLADAVEAAGFRLPGVAKPARSQLRDVTSTLLRDYLIARLGDMDGPLLVAVFGPTGSGKSTIVNALAGRQVSPAGVIRPTTRAPVVWCRRGLADRYRDRAFEGAAVVEDEHPLLRSLTLVDTPDLDSYAEENRLRAERILAVADAGVFVTTPQRYADAVPWEVMRRLSDRGMPITFVMNRLSRRSSGSLADYAAVLRREGVADLARDEAVVIHEQRRGDGVLPRSVMKGLGEVIEDLSVRRAELILESIDGAISAARRGSSGVATEVDRQHGEAVALAAAVDGAYQAQLEDLRAHLARGDLIRAEVINRWQRLIGVSDLAAVVSRGVGRIRDMFRPRQVAAGFESEVNQEMVAMVANRAQRAVNTVVTAWEIDPGGRELLSPELRRTGSDTPALAATEIESWLAGLVHLVREEGKGRFQLARAASLGVNAAASVLLVSVFAATGGLTGAEVGVVAGTAAAQQTILEHVFGRAAASRLAQRARDDLESRLARVLDEDAGRFRRIIEANSDPPATGVAIGSAADLVARRAKEWADARSA